MNKEERDREKEIKRLIYVRNELIKQTKKEIKQLRDELNRLGKEDKYEESISKHKRLVRRKQG